ncbi:hypothetical protein D3C73_798700 [compost metagenome]
MFLLLDLEMPYTFFVFYNGSGGESRYFVDTHTAVQRDQGEPKMKRMDFFPGIQWFRPVQVAVEYRLEFVCLE